MISVVYSCYMVNDWKDRAIRQLSRLKTSGLYDKSDEIYFIGTDPENSQLQDLNSIISDFPKIQVEVHTRNWYEGYALRKVDFLGRTSEVNKKILYFHSKGVFNKFKNFSTGEIDPLKIKSVENWTDVMEHFLIDNWEICLDKLDSYHTVGSSIYAYWYWGNFWWANSEHIKTNVPFDDYFGGSRWQCESWLHDSNTDRESIKFFEFYHFNYNPFYTFIPERIYKKEEDSSTVFEIIEAKYGYFAHQVDEGRGLDILEDVTIDVTDAAKELNYKKTENKNIFLYPEELAFEDPIPGTPKNLRLKFKINNDTKEYVVTSYFSNPIKLL